MRRVSVMLYWLSYPSQDSYSKSRDLSELCVTDYYLYKWKGSTGSQVGVTLPDLPPTPQLRSLPQFLTIFSSNVRQIMCLPQSPHLLTRGHTFALLFYDFVSLHRNISVINIIHVSYICCTFYIVYQHTCNSLGQWSKNFTCRHTHNTDGYFYNRWCLR